MYHHVIIYTQTDEKIDIFFSLQFYVLRHFHSLSEDFNTHTGTFADNVSLYFTIDRDGFKEILRIYLMVRLVNIARQEELLRFTTQQ